MSCGFISHIRKIKSGGDTCTPVCNKKGLFIKQVQMISIIINPIQYIVEKVDIIWGNFHVIMGFFVIIKTEEYHCLLEYERKIIKSWSEK